MLLMGVAHSSSSALHWNLPRRQALRSAGREVHQSKESGSMPCLHNPRPPRVVSYSECTDGIRGGVDRLHSLSYMASDRCRREGEEDAGGNMSISAKIFYLRSHLIHFSIARASLGRIRLHAFCAPYPYRERIGQSW